LFELEKQVDVLNNIDAMIDVGINFAGYPPELMQLLGGAEATPEMLSATAGVIGSGLAGFAGFAEGGIVRKPVLGLIGEAGPEAVVPLNQMAGASPLGAMGGNTTVLNVTVEGSVLSEMDLTDVIQAQLIRTKNRNASLEFA